ncbi:MAG: hypothetical protein IIX94_04420, partial [Clostridia bacterium]|nr:hypothetical protein [Clostridia bacterium]
GFAFATRRSTSSLVRRRVSEFSALPRYPYGRFHVPFRASGMFPYDEAQGKGIAKGEIPVY